MHKCAALFVVAVGWCSLLLPASARWKEEYAKVSPDERAWYERQQTTPETRARLHASWYQFCCDHADTVKAKFLLRQDHWFYQLDGETEWRTMPQDIVQSDVQTPHSNAVLFVDVTGHGFGPVCFFPGGTGT